LEKGLELLGIDNSSEYFKADEKAGIINFIEQIPDQLLPMLIEAVQPIMPQIQGAMEQMNSQNKKG
jgi:hypothetical protein